MSLFLLLLCEFLYFFCLTFFIHCFTSPNEHNTDNKENEAIENTFEGGRFYFPSAHEPVSETGTYGTQQAFATAIIKGTVPTLLFHGRDFACSRQTPIQSIFPIQFPYGLGGVHEKRKNKVSEIECLRHYLRLSLPQFQRPDFILVVLGMYHRIKSFTSGLVKCKSLLRGKTLAEQVASLSESDIKKQSKSKQWTSYFCFKHCFTIP